MHADMNWDELHGSRGTRARPVVIAHRGVPVKAPENTLGSFSLALTEGADVLETDLRFSKDDAIVLFHDDTLDRMTDGIGPVEMHTLDEIKRLRTRTPNGNLSEAQVPTLKELLAATEGKTPLLLELKDPKFAQREYAERLVQLLVDESMLEKCAIISFKSELVRSVKSVRPSIPTGHIAMFNPIARPNTELLGPFWPLLYANPLYVRMAHSMGSIVAPLDPKPESRMGYYMRLKVDAVLADDPASVLRSMDGTRP